MGSIIMSKTTSKADPAKCSLQLAKWLDMSDPHEMEDAVMLFVPTDQPLRDEVLNTLVKLLKLEVGANADDSDKLMAVISAVTLKAVQKENNTRRSVSVAGRVTIDETHDLIKVVLTGDSGVGKTCLMVRFVKDEFESSTKATIGMDFCTRNLNVDVLQASESSVVQKLTVQVWDTAGQEQFQSLTSTYYRKAGGVMIMYDATNRKSFESLPRWIKDVDDHSEGVVKMIVATKADGTLAVPNADGEAFARENGCLFAPTSAKDGTGILTAFQNLSTAVLAAQESKERQLEEIKESIVLGQEPAAKKGGYCC